MPIWAWVTSAWLCVAGPVRADEAALSWVRLDGAEECIAAPMLAKLVEARLGRPVLQSPSRAERSIEARVGRHPEGGWLAVIRVNDRAGRRLGERELRVPSGPCSELDRPASLAISLIIDPNAVGPSLLENGALSSEAQRLLSQIELPSGDPDALLASLDFTPARNAKPPERAEPEAPRGTKTEPARPDAPSQVRMVSVPAAEWSRLHALDGSGRDAGADTPTPAFPGYILLGAGAAAAGAAVYALVHRIGLNDDAGFQRYRDAVSRGNLNNSAAAAPVTDVCVPARQGMDFGLGASATKHAANVCDSADQLQVLFWVFTGVAIASASAGAAWLLWIADHPQAESHPQSSPRVSIAPAVGSAFTGLVVRARL